MELIIIGQESKYHKIVTVELGERRFYRGKILGEDDYFVRLLDAKSNREIRIAKKNIERLEESDIPYEWRDADENSVTGGENQ